MWLNLLVDHHLQFGYQLQHHKIEEEKQKKTHNKWARPHSKEVKVPL
jgi:hypothetical protein